MFEKGKSGNPSGRPKDSFGPVLRDMLDTLGEGSQYTERALIAQKLIDLAKSGEIQAIRYIMDRIDGTPTSKQEVTGKDGGPLYSEAKVLTDDQLRRLAELQEEIDRGGVDNK
jgi:hypothetical protein